MAYISYELPINKWFSLSPRLFHEKCSFEDPIINAATIGQAKPPSALLWELRRPTPAVLLSYPKTANWKIAIPGLDRTVKHKSNNHFRWVSTHPKCPFRYIFTRITYKFIYAPSLVQKSQSYTNQILLLRAAVLGDSTQTQKGSYFYLL